jgi:hypothetical protein
MGAGSMRLLSGHHSSGDLPVTRNVQIASTQVCWPLATKKMSVSPSRRWM